MKNIKNLFNNGRLSEWLLFYAGILVLFVYLIYAAILPAYWSPNSRLWSSPVGYPAILRKLHTAIPVEVASPKLQTMSRVISAAGAINFLHEIPINIEVASIVTQVFVESGSKIKVGDVLARLDNGGNPTRIARLDVEDKRSAYEKAKKDFLREKEAFKSGLIAQTEFAQFEADMNQARIELEKAQESLSGSFESRSKSIFGKSVNGHGNAKTEIVSPINGSVIAVDAYAGENIVEPRDSVMVLGDTLMFKAAVDQRYFASVQVGNEATVYLHAYPDIAVKAKVAKIDNIVAVNQDAAGTVPYTFNVWLELSADHAQAIQFVKGMNGYCRFEYPFQALAIPEKALIKYSGQRGLVMAVSQDDTLEMRQVSYSASIDGMVAISAGLSAADRVVLSGQTGLLPGDKISAKTP
ncbi:efflux RND transporter periplasmic adaptor subunit [Methylomonas sp. 2BW1-5-20]|uniref:efflux RND transporter periplasmic adaptor subunit n=1 Tax=Methylomonas sp. 2BW1-5-20 TaxID=3376686 RepID=UPI00404E46BA